MSTKIYQVTVSFVENRPIEIRTLLIGVN